jgi:putative colanic acid biosysnthesis UDP-glucose lipid carrier transferase
MLALWKQTKRPPGASAAEPSAVFIIRSLLYPIVTVATLIATLMIWDEPIGGPYIIVGVLAFISVADFLEVTQMDGRPTRLGALRSLIDTTLHWIAVGAFVYVLLYISGLTGQLNKDVLTTWIILTPLMLWIAQMATLQFGVRHIPARRAVVVGMTDLGLRLETRLREDPLLCTNVVGFFEDRGLERLPVTRPDSILGKCTDLPDFIGRNAINVVYITLPMNRNPRIVNLIDSLRDSTASIYFAPDLFMFNLIQGRLDLVSGIPMIAVRESPFFGWHGAAKRFCDVLVAAVFLFLLSPLMLAIALAVTLTSSGPVLFRQKRYGLDGKPIIVYKFRSMSVVEDGESTYTQVSRGDMRVTPVGAFIRRTSLDELPQLLNVLEGSMSIVGPRPHAVAVNEQYRRLIPSYMVRHKVKPGITGWAQVNGYRGGDDLESMTKRVQYDLHYLSHWSLGLDIIIILKTATLIWKDRSAY